MHTSTLQSIAIKEIKTAFIIHAVQNGILDIHTQVTV